MKDLDEILRDIRTDPEMHESPEEVKKFMRKLGTGALRHDPDGTTYFRKGSKWVKTKAPWEIK